MGKTVYSSLRCYGHGHLLNAHRVLDVSGCSYDTDCSRALRYLLQRGVRIQLGTYPLVIPTRDYAASGQIKRCFTVHSYKLGFQLGRRRIDAYPARTDTVETLPATRLLLLRIVRGRLLPIPGNERCGLGGNVS